MAVELRRARPEEVEALQQLFGRSGRVWESSRRIMDEHPELVEPAPESVADGHVRVAVEDGRIVGFSTVVPDDGAAELEALFVDVPDLRRGLGRALVDDAIDVVRAAGLGRLDVVANPHAVGFYERVGFVSLGPAPTDHGPAERMTLDVHRDQQRGRRVG